MVLAKAWRDEPQPCPGDRLEAEGSSKQVTLSPLRANTPVQKERGVWVYRTWERLPAAVVNDTLRHFLEGVTEGAASEGASPAGAGPALFQTHCGVISGTLHWAVKQRKAEFFVV
jgi:hypothetical protein